MIRKYGKKVVSIAVASAMAAGVYVAPINAQSADAATETVKVQLLGVNDLHGYIAETAEVDYNEDGVTDKVGTLSYMATYMEQLEAQNPNTLLVHAGDMIGGSPLVSAYFQDEPVVEIMEEMGFDVGTIGNHEFDEGIAELERMVNGGTHPDGKGSPEYDGMNFPVIAANAFDKSTGELILEPYYVAEVAGQKIGFIGVVTTETPDMIIRTGNENLEITSEVEAINKYAKELKDQGVQSIVVLAHNPVSQDGPQEGTTDAAYIAENVDDEVDVIFAAHNHSVVDRVVDNKLIVQAWEYGKAFSAVNIEIDPATGDIVNKEGEIVFVDQSVEPDEEVQTIIDTYEAKVEDVKAEVAGTTEAVLEGGYAGRGEVGDNALGNLIADGMKWSMGADIALMNGGGIRNDIQAGEITFGELFSVQPFSNVNVKFELTGYELLDVLNNQINSYGPDFSISGFTYTWNYATQEVVELFNPDGSEFDLDKTYTVVTNNYMFYNAKYGFTNHFEGEPEVGKVDVDATFEYIKHLAANGPIEYAPEGRIAEVVYELPFTDVKEDDWYYNYVTELYVNEISHGTTETTFSPNGTLTRAQFASMLVRALGLESTEPTPFTDLENVHEDTVAEIAAAYENGLVVGTTPTTFDPYAPIKRSQMVTMLMRAYELAYGEAYELQGEVSFDDIAALDLETEWSILAAAELGFVSGYDNVFKPYNLATRAQSAKVLSLFLEL
ncbi:5'-nucleotidase C-terminal domain-containing protein [Bacillus litorisediminis]|uniref:5'-nucleotidase C-terminal domain-containing protein n=1 Tax=Bacillus litorisediminis TaxID=2922713 RepID=UPI001FAF6E4A|nr:5'-nucleotidase C-terminal domain-containing protein [Bacillus litorisediminis]